MSESITSTADYIYIEAALKSQWHPFIELMIEINSFTPRPLSDFDEQRKSLFAHLQKLNPTSSDKSLTDLVDTQISAVANERMQFQNRFSERFMNIYVTVAFLSHALCEAEINTILAFGLYKHGAPELFSVIGKTDIKEKWRIGPKVFCPSYELKSGSAIFETLNHLTKQRNALTHYKVHLTVDEKSVVEGSKFERLSIKDNAKWMRRFFSLPYDLATHAHSQIRESFAFMLWDRSPIEIADVHKPNIKPA